MIKTILRSALVLLITASAARAQVDVTASAGTASASYTTLKAAFDAINSGLHQGVIGIAITGNTNELATASLLASGGASSWSQVVIQPQGGASRTISGALSTALVELNGADNVVIDGLASGGNSLTLVNSSAATTASTLRFVNDATGNTVQNCSLQGSSTAATTGTVVFSTGASSGNDSNLLTGCDIGPAGTNLPFVAVYSLGSTGSVALYNSSVTLSNNRIHDFFSAATSAYGVELLAGNTDWTISGNSFFQSASRVPTAAGTVYGVSVSNTANGNNFNLTGNFIGGSAASAGGSPWTWNSPAVAYAFTGLYVNATTASIQGNTIANLSWTANGVWRGIQAPVGTVNIGTVTGNTIGAPAGTNSISINHNSASAVTDIGIDIAGQGTLNVANNTIGSITGAGNSLNLFGINSVVGSAGVGSGSITGNLVGSLTTGNSMAITSANSVGGQVIGINLTGTPPAAGLMVSGNTVANLSSASITASQRSVHGIDINTVGAAYYVVTGNTIRNLSSAATGTSIAPASVPLAGIGVTMTSGTATVTNTISQNVVYSLVSTSATGSVTVEGIGMGTSNGSFGAYLVSRNLVHSLSAISSAACNLYGIAINNGTAVRYQNNMVRLGVDASGNPVTGPYTIVGIGADATANVIYAAPYGVGLYFNTVWIGGAASGGAANSFAYYRGFAGHADTLKDNILVNQRTGGTGRHFAFSVNTAASKLTDFNIYWTGGSSNVASVDNATTALSSLQAMRGTTTGWDVNSGLGDPRLVAPAADAAGLSLKLQTATPAEGNGLAIAGITDDQEGDPRASNTPADVGADAGLYTTAGAPDIYPPVISVTPLANTGLLSDRTLTATITDIAPAGGGVPASGSLMPRVWYRKSTSPSWTLSAPG
ncbi:MAG: beta strand repeat-containing protein, partial [Candidatus Eiseniibacteriota bacterium]